MAELRQTTEGQSDNFVSIQDIFYLCVSKWKWFVLSLLVLLSFAVIKILRTPPVYTRTASILIKEDSKGGSMSSDVADFSNMGLFQTKTNVNNELVALQSPDIMYEVVKRLHLDMNYSVPGRFHSNVAYGTTLPVNVTISGLGENESAGFEMTISEDGKVQLGDFIKGGEKFDVSKTADGNLRETIETPVGAVVVTPTPYYKANTAYQIKVSRSGLYGTANAYLSNVSIAHNDEKTTVINLTINDASTQRAEDVLNTLISVYNENWVKNKNQIAVSTSMFINERLAVIESELGNVDEDISSYKSQNLVPDVQAASSMYMAENSQTNSQIMTLNNQLYMARYIRNYLADDTNKYKLLPANSGIDNSNIEALISEYNTQLLTRNNLVANSSVQNPLVVDMDTSLDGMRGAIVASVDNLMTALNTQIRSLQQTAQQTTARIAENPTQAKYLLSVERQQKVKESLYLFLLQKREENELSQAFTAYNTQIIKSPSGSMSPTSPEKTMILLVAFVIGLLIPIVVIFLKESLNTKIRGRKDLEGVTVPFIGEIPLFSREKKGLFSKKHKDVNAIVVKEGKRDVINEAFRVLRTNLEFMSEKGNVIIVTSFNAGSGKSFMSMNIAVSLALKQKKVLVIDGDLRRASTSAYVGSPAYGLSDYLNGREKILESLIVTDKKYEHLDILPVGTLPPNPTELLFNERMKQVIEQVKKEYDYIFIDCPPVEMVADAQILGKLADRTIFVVRAGLFERGMLTELEQYYADQKYKNMALILNGTKGSGSRYGYRYGYNYGYGYGYSYHYGTSKHGKGNKWLDFS